MNDIKRFIAWTAREQNDFNARRFDNIDRDTESTNRIGRGQAGGTFPSLMSGVVREPSQAPKDRDAYSTEHNFT